MSQLYHSSLLISLRGLARRTGLLSILKRFVGRRTKKYEDAFHKAMEAAIKEADVVWDVGANVGLYTFQFTEWVGSQGRVVAFEPLPEAYRSILNKCSGLQLSSRCEVIPCALSDSDYETFLSVQPTKGEAITTTGHIVDRNDTQLNSESIKIECRRADYFIEQGRVPAPTVTKIDVEGFELEVLQGGKEAFSSKSSKHLFIEVHFTRLTERGMRHAPKHIVKLLQDLGYFVRWVDPSHIHAERIGLLAEN